MEHFDVVSRLRPFRAGDHRIGICQLPKLHALLAGNGGADHDHGANALGQFSISLGWKYSTDGSSSFAGFSFLAGFSSIQRRSIQNARNERSLESFRFFTVPLFESWFLKFVTCSRPSSFTSNKPCSLHQGRNCRSNRPS